MTSGGPAPALRAGTGFCDAAAVLSAVGLGLFTALAGGRGATAGEVSARVGLHPRAAGDFLNLLVTLGLLVRDDARYRNAEVTERHFVRGSPGYAGAFLEGAAHTLYPAWGGLTQLLRTGAAPGAAPAAGFAEMLRDPAARQGYLSMMDALSAPLAPAIDALVDWRGVRTVTDVGGNRGNLLGLLLARHPDALGQVFDLPEHEADFRAHTRALDVADRASFRGGDFFTDPLPHADLVILGHVLANWNAEQIAGLLAAAHDAVAPGGWLVVYDPLRDPARPDREALVASLHLALMTPGGGGYTTDQYGQWISRTGFTLETVRPAGPRDTVIAARRPLQLTVR